MQQSRCLIEKQLRMKYLDVPGAGVFSVSVTNVARRKSGDSPWLPTLFRPRKPKALCIRVVTGSSVRQEVGSEGLLRGSGQQRIAACPHFYQLSICSDV